MRLKSIEMQGFKSFPEKTKINFDNGVTAIIGPNGSGKSNISDAVRWVLGEMSAKSLRGSRMEDVIFNGAAGRQPSNYSSVSIAFDTEEEFNDAQNSVIDIDEVIQNNIKSEQKNKGKNTASIVPKMRLSDHKEVTVTRRYYRSGESEYYINKNQIRLKDIYELFYDTGIGREGYSVIGQGKISEVLSQKGDERRSIFEEAAGISKFRYKKSEAERKLKETENNLIRINDILNEVTSRIGPLAKEAENAKQYLNLSEEKKGLEITLWLNKIDELKSNLDKGNIAFNSAKYTLEQSEEKVKTLESSLDSIINENYELSRILSETEHKKSDAGQKNGELKGKKAVLFNDISHFNRIIEENKQTLDSSANNIMLTSKLIEQALKVAEEINKEIGEITNQVHKSQAEYENKHTLTLSLQKQLEEANTDYSMLFERNASIMSIGAKINAELELATRSKNGVSENISTSEQRITELENELEKSKLAELDSKIAYESNIKLKNETERKLTEFRNDNEKLKEDIVAKRLALAADEQKREHLTRLEQLFEGYSTSVRNIISDTKQGKITKNGKPISLHGTVSSVMSTEGEYVVALETALAASIQFIIVDNEDDAKTAIEYLKTNKLGRATFLPLTTVKGKRCNIENIKNIPGFIGIASDLAKFDKKYEGIIDDLLGRTVIATNIDAAIKIAGKSGYRIKTVTCDGQIINPGGSFTGGSSAKKVGLLTRAIDIERLSAEIKLKNAALLDKERDSAALSKKISEAVEYISNTELLITHKKADLDIVLSVKNTLLIRLEEEKKRRDSLISGKNDDENRLLNLLKQKEKFSFGANADEVKLNSAKCLLSELRSKANSARNEEETIYEKLNTDRITLLEKRSAYDRQNELLKQFTDKKNTYEKRIVELKASSEKALSDIGNCENEIAVFENDKSNILEKIKTFDEQMQNLLLSRENKEKETNDIRANVKQTQANKEEAFRSYTSLEAKQIKLNNDYEDVSSKLWDEYELTYSAALPFKLSEEMMQKAPSRLSALKSRIKTMGSINVNAVDEYKQEKERYDFLTAQTDDLNKTRRSLDNAIAKLNTKMKQTFINCFDSINKEFGKVFSMLFGGGSAYIELVDPEAPLECGIDIIIKPPGKSVKSISLLSGGEQSFAAIALYLALQKINPAPFCIFDEIESALDDINLVKFADYVKENSDKTQYILITHRRGTMERADTLYGITMRQKGISDYIKLNISMLQENIKEYIK